MLSSKDLITQMSSDLGMLPQHVSNIIRTAPIRYKIFYIPKKKGGIREVAQPAREVKAIQYWLIRKLESQLPIHSAATAYHPGSSIKFNAAQHSGSNYLLKMDFKDFFPSIYIGDIVRHLELHCGTLYDISAIKLIAYTCCWSPRRQGPLRLCIGAPSSPLISNSIMFELDSRLAEIAKMDGVKYTRYADDLAFSSSGFNVLSKYIELVKTTVNEIDCPHLTINNSKTVLASRGGKRVITGITLTPDHKLSIGRDRKRLIRAMYHRYLCGELSEKESEKLIGLLAFADNIEPGFTERIIESYKTKFLGPASARKPNGRI